MKRVKREKSYEKKKETAVNNLYSTFPSLLNKGNPMSPKSAAFDWQSVGTAIQQPAPQTLRIYISYLLFFFINPIPSPAKQHLLPDCLSTY